VNAVTVLGAGPYGLAVAVHLRAAGAEVCVLGDPMSFWAGSMPAGMLLRSPRVASSISDPRDELDLDGYGMATGNTVGAPVPLASFVEYGRWFQRTVVPEVDARQVETVRRHPGGFELELADGSRLHTERLVVAAGIAAFAHLPRVLRDLPTDRASHSSWHTDLGAFAGQRVLVIGGGQSALESAALLHEGGAAVELVSRAPAVRWLGQRPWLRSLGPVSRLLYAPPEVGPPLLSQLVRYPGWVGRLPARRRHALDRRSIRPAGAGWLKPRVDGLVPLRGGRVMTDAKAGADGVTVTFDDGSQQTVDHVLAATGYRVDLARYPFLSCELLGEIRQAAGYPLLNRGFESSVPGLHFVGATAAWSFGPLMRFVAGTGFAASAVTRHLAAGARRKALGAVVRT